MFIVRDGKTCCLRPIALAGALCLLASARLAAQCGPIDDPRQVIDIYLEMEPADWEAVQHDSSFENERPALFRACGEGPLPVTVRRKKGRAFPSEENPAKPGLKIDFDDPVEDGEWRGHRKLSIENGYSKGPSALIREGLAWHFMRQAGVVTGAFSWVRLHVNDRLVGFYTHVEQIDKSFLRRRVGEDDGFLYKLDYLDVNLIVRLTRIGEPDPYAPDLCFPPFGGTCDIPRDAPERAREHLDVRQLITFAAVNAAIANPDGLLINNNNYFFYNSGRPRLYFPWDHDIVFLEESVHAEPHLGGTPDTYPGFFFGDPGLAAEFDAVLGRLVRDALSLAAVSAFLDDIAPTVGPALDSDPLNGIEGGFAGEAARLESWIGQRDSFLESRTAGHVPSPIVINEIVAANAASGADEAGENEDWVEIHNRGGQTISLAGNYLSDDPAEPLKWAFPAVAVPAGGFLLVWCDRDTGQGPLHADFQLDAEGEAVGLYSVLDGIVRTVDFVAFGPQATDVALARSPDGAPGFRPRACPTPGAANAGACPEGPRFVRGDASEDGALNLTDAVRILGGLFLGQPLTCEAAADADGDGQVSLTDAVRVLAHLFQGGPEPEAPFPLCGTDPGGSGLECEGNAACAGAAGARALRS